MSLLWQRTGVAADLPSAVVAIKWFPTMTLYLPEPGAMAVKLSCAVMWLS
jgi:hypothetical protein